MKKYLLLFMMILSFVSVLGCANEEDNRIKVAVSIVPQAEYVESIGGDLVDVVTVIPVGFSPENYEPSARQIVGLNNVDVYFTMGVPAESSNILPELNDLNIVRLEEQVSAVYDDRYFDHDHSHDEEDDHQDDDHEVTEFSRDPHIWLSIKRVKVMVQVIADELSDLDPENESIYQSNAADYIVLLDELDADITAMFASKTMTTFIVYHPSYGYFADDYGLTMMALEEDGKEPTITHLQELIDFARDNDIDRIYHQAEIDSEQVETFANDIDGQTIRLYPLSINYLAAMRDMAEKIAEGMS